MTHVQAWLCAFGLFWLLLPREAAAYIDVGAGSMLLQTLVAAALGALYVVKLRWRSLRSRLRRGAGSDPEGEPGDRTPSEDR